MSVLAQKRTVSKAEFINVANQIYVETMNFLTRLCARCRACGQAGRRGQRPFGESKQHLPI